MGEKEKHPWKPPELAPPMPDFDDFSNQCVAEKHHRYCRKDYTRTRKTIRLLQHMNRNTEHE